MVRNNVRRLVLANFDENSKFITVTFKDSYKCSHCRVRNVSKIEGKEVLQYYHSFAAFILAGEKFATMLDIEAGTSRSGGTNRRLPAARKSMYKFEAVAGDALYLAGEAHRGSSGPTENTALLF